MVIPKDGQLIHGKLMTTSEFIKLLQKEDPSGKLHVHVRGEGCPVFVNIEPGYYDGSYYFKEKDKWMISKIGDKLTVRCSSPFNDAEYAPEQEKYDWEGFSKTFDYAQDPKGNDYLTECIKKIYDDNFVEWNSL